MCISARYVDPARQMFNKVSRNGVIFLGAIGEFLGLRGSEGLGDISE